MPLDYPTKFTNTDLPSDDHRIVGHFANEKNKLLFTLCPLTKSTGFLESELSQSRDNFRDELQKTVQQVLKFVLSSTRRSTKGRCQPITAGGGYNSEQNKMIRETEFGLVVSANSAGGLFILVDTVRAGSVSGSASASTYADPATVNTYTKFPSNPRERVSRDTENPFSHRKSKARSQPRRQSLSLRVFLSLSISFGTVHFVAKPKFRVSN